MPSPFPGMDPYLEAPDLWPDVHQALAYTLREQLTPQLRPRYAALVHHHIEVDHVEPEEGEVVRSSGVRGDVAVVEGRDPSSSPGRGVAVSPAPVRLALPRSREVKHFRIEVLAERGKRLVAVVEILSRANKVPGRDRDAFAAKRQGYLDSDVHYLELDPLRAGARWKVRPEEPESDYRVLLSRGARSREAEIWPVSVRDPLPVVPLPLLAPDPDLPLDLGGALARAYEGAGYDALVDYAADPPTRFAGAQAAWVRERAAQGA